MAYEVTIKEVTTEVEKGFNKDTNSFTERNVELFKEVVKYRVDGYKPNFRKDVLAFLVEKDS